MRGRAPDYPGMQDPRADMEKLREAYFYTATLQTRFHISSPIYDLWEPIRAPMRAAALEVTRDPYFFGGYPYGKPMPAIPDAPPIPGIIRVKLSNGLGRKSPA